MPNESLSATIRDALQSHAHAVTRQRAALARLLSLTDNEMLAVEHLMRANGLTPGQLSARLQLSTGGTTALVQRLQRAGHLVRDKHPRDRRSVILRLTPTIQRRTSALLSFSAGELDGLIAGLPDDERRVVERFLSDVADCAARQADRLVGEADAGAEAVLAVPAPALWS